MSTSLVLDGKQAGDEVLTSHKSALREDVGATSAEYESRQDYLQGTRLRLITAAYVASRHLSDFLT